MWAVMLKANVGGFCHIVVGKVRVEGETLRALIHKVSMPFLARNLHAETVNQHIIPSKGHLSLPKWYCLLFQEKKWETHVNVMSSILVMD